MFDGGRLSGGGGGWEGALIQGLTLIIISYFKRKLPVTWRCLREGPIEITRVYNKH